MTLTLSPLMQRTALAKTLGFLVGIGGFYATRAWLPDAPLMLAWGVLALYLTIGGVVGMMGAYDRIPFFDVPLPPVLRGAAMGAWMTLLVLLFAAPVLAPALATAPYLPDMFRAPWWMILDGLIVGAAIDVIVSAWKGDVVGFGVPS